MAREKELFISRWSRRKLGGARAAEAPKPAAPAAAPAAEAPPLPSLDSLGFDSDYRGFLHPKVDAALRRAALKKLFSSPQFNTQDMLDDFAEDYTLLESLSAEDLQKITHAKRSLLGGEPEAAAPAEPQVAQGETQAGEAPAAPQETAQADPAPADPGKSDGAAG